MPHIMPSEINGCWTIKNQFLARANAAPIDYRVSGGSPAWDYPLDAIFYLHGLAGGHEDCIEINGPIEATTRLIRIQNFGLRLTPWSVPALLVTATFGDICAYFNNTAKTVQFLANKLNSRSYGVVAHSWGGMIASVIATHDERCKKAMLIVSSPDICSVLANSYQWMGPLANLPFTSMSRIRDQALKAIVARSAHQVAWEAISPWQAPLRQDLDMLIYNRAEDRLMQRDRVEHFVDYCRQRGVGGVTAEFRPAPELKDPHDGPYSWFRDKFHHYFGL